MASQISRQYCIPADHPCLAGHFPGSPIVPGVVLLDYVRMLLESWQPQLRIKTLSQAKFLKPLAPEQPFTVQLRQDSVQRVKFECLTATEKLISGTFIVETKT